MSEGKNGLRWVDIMFSEAKKAIAEMKTLDPALNESYLAGVMLSHVQRARVAEHDRVEMLIGEMNFTECREMVRRCRMKVKFYAETERRRSMELAKTSPAAPAPAHSELKTEKVP